MMGRVRRIVPAATRSRSTFRIKDTKRLGKRSNSNIFLYIHMCVYIYTYVCILQYVWGYPTTVPTSSTRLCMNVRMNICIYVLVPGIDVNRFHSVEILPRAARTWPNILRLPVPFYFCRGHTVVIVSNALIIIYIPYMIYIASWKCMYVCMA